MTTEGCDVSALDRPEVLQFLFHPRKDETGAPPQEAMDFSIHVEENVELKARFYLSDPSGAHILFFHGNREIASDYDNMGLRFNRFGLSFLIVDYRGYGNSSGQPTATTLLSDAHRVFSDVLRWLEHQRRTGVLIIMGRSLGSVPALEVASCHQDAFAGLSLESGFARTVSLLNLFGVPTDTLSISESNGFANFGKIRAIAKPTLIIYGSEDDIVVREDADILLANSGAERKQLIIAPGCGHNDIASRCGELYYQTVSHFAEMLERLRLRASREGGFDRRYPRGR